MNNSSKCVWLVRHGKSAWPADTPDMERPLSQRGRRDGAAMAEVLATSEHIPQKFYTSDSERTRQTTELLNDALKLPITSTHDLYTGSHRDVEKLLRKTERSLSCVAVVSHLPTIDSCIRATNDWPEEHAFPTLAAVCYEVGSEWEEFEFKHARFLRFFIPRMFRDASA
ncbi:MAG: hypothetical protein F4X56_05755 [Gammaproteobacteria bacterium]|nr:histidine phosphatase family protein [Gammaproteobacteria bacterium]MXW07711.1 hypothetical protein [Gammaproteobacteria bacterium]MYC25407.1 hypothetical protein [Gammaproteobacteria bacterium]